MTYEKVKFVNFDDFYQNRKLLRILYKELSLSDKIMLKRFIYDEMKMYENDKDCIWNFLNENEFCKKELMTRYNTIHNRKCRVHNLYEMENESIKIKKINNERENIFDII